MPRLLLVEDAPDVALLAERLARRLGLEVVHRTDVAGAWESVRQSAPCFSATARYIAKIIGAGELIVIDVVMSASVMPSNRRSMSASDITLTPHLPTSPSDSG